MRERYSVLRSMMQRKAHASAADVKAGDESQRPICYLEGMVSRTSPKLEGRVLYIEDNATNILLLQSWAEKFQGFELLVAETGEKGLLAYERERPDAVIVDLYLPDMPGSEVLRQLRRLSDGRPVPIAVLTAHTSAEYVQESIRGGAVAYWTKPVDLVRLEHDLSDLLMSRHGV